MVQRIKTDPSRGTIVATRPSPTTHVHAKVYTRPSTVLSRLNKVKDGGAPDICIVRSQGGIGDVLMSLPTVRAISKQYNCLVDYATAYDYLGGALPAVLQHNPYIRQVLSWRDVDPELYNAVLDITCPCVAHEKAKAPPVNRIDLFARHAGLLLDNHSIDYYPQQAELNEAYQLLASHGLRGGREFKLILVQPSSSTSRRDLPVQVLAQILRDILEHNKSARAIVLTHSEDKVSARDVTWQAIDGVLHLQDKKVREIASLIWHSDLVLCPDSAILHLAGALEKKTLSFFGPTDPRARINYFPQAIAIWPGSHLHCCPCWYEACKVGYVCWKQISVRLTVDTALALLQNRPVEPHPDLHHFGSLIQGSANVSGGELL